MTPVAPVRRRRAGRLVAPAVLVTVLLVALLGPWLAPQDPTRTTVRPFAPPGGRHLLGADQLGRDVLSRLLSGGLPILAVPLLCVVVSTVAGTAVGLALAAGRRRGARAIVLLDVALLTPAIVVLLVGAAVLGPGTLTLVVVVTLVSAPQSARYVRSLAAPILDTGYVEVAEAAGDRRTTVLVREVVPGLRRPVLADAGLRLTGAVYLVSTAGFLGLNPLSGWDDWATLLRDTLPGALLNPVGVLAPVVAIALVTVPANLLADQLVERPR